MATHRESGQNALGHFRERSDSMTDITELAQRARINAECGEHLSPAETLELVEALESEKRICATWRKTAKSTGEKLEKAQTINAAAEKLVRCKGRYHSEQNYRALAALFGVKTPDLPPLEHENVHYADAAEIEIAALRQRIAELECRTVKLPKLKMLEDYLAEVAIEERKQILVGVKLEFHRACVAAGIKVEAE
ncbi:ead/Ea22-like family protein [Klebsiella pneumoniae]|uniref:ead/Ea22-like family protein n=1 Tax=Klebsiella pneumoniae TaxID=573 RepID=UPI001CFBE576|nr:ead/Ea22-like family protein [Klebsiella pneumoniae]MCS6646212.1 ead/Ea22-like family protein [Klebsiella pneumoniae subsp. pneumoniae]UDC00865.1 ead/Ea22-like family protein [Klebsiella pneumoniae]